MTAALATALSAALALKALPRAGWVRIGVPAPESVASHSWGIAWLVTVLCPADLDRGRALAMAAIHDLPEVIVGDLTPHDGVSEVDKSAREAEAMRTIAAPLPNGEELVGLWLEYDAGETPIARFVKACDKLDMALQAAIYRRERGLDTSEFIASALARLPPGMLTDLARAVAPPHGG